ncbi:MAG: 4-hydroxy-tetrahydrodipicolinate reductase [Sphingomonas sp.]|uniref:4-hydroxy-tetrahydrodipicolinate reductase n=1 Tax=Sphingomonas sp. TaxID=28214 RepID=UPI0025E4C8F0|nr:4-hydroxy-tetrahydrodipicolinate reductase [Sphingomonas sp.]MBX9882187.1 4-hydroxy-tetrahydrodipicolinate reductase [Sphingomonas sp.]
MVAIGILGSAGRMGRAIAAAIPEYDARLAGGVDAGGDVRALAEAADVLVDFTHPRALPGNLAVAAETGTPILIGTTGLSPNDHAAIDAAALEIAVLQTGNTSLGVTLLARLVREAAARLGPGWDIEIVEMHHRAKVDAPSGTAQLLGAAAAEGRGSSLGELAVIGRAGLTGDRAEGTIGIASLRGGSVAGDHQVVFAGPGERIELGHRAENREIFARGAITAARWLAGRAPGRYTMAQVLGL